MNKLIHSFCVMNGSIRLKIVENRQTYIITHLSDLEELFPGKNLFLIRSVLAQYEFSDFLFFEFSMFYGFILFNIEWYLVIR